MVETVTQVPAYDYLARHVAIGIGWITFALDATDGTIMIANGWIGLYGDQGQLFDAAPVIKVRVKTAFRTNHWLKIRFPGQTYMVYVGGPILAFKQREGNKALKQTFREAVSRAQNDSVLPIARRYAEHR